jgi:hypothetical protein
MQFPLFGHDWTAPGTARAYPLGATPAPGANPKTAPYLGPFPRKRHAHRCQRCGQGRSVACYKQHCHKARVTATCMYCS